MDKAKNMRIISGGSYQDERGNIRYVNSFNLDSAKRFYLIEQNKDSNVRAWQGHRVEEKYFYVTSGAFMICGVEIDDWNSPSEDLKANIFTLFRTDNKLLHIPAGCANGLKALEENSQVLVFSSLSLEEAKKDDYRYPSDLWVDWEKEARRLIR